MTEAPSSQVVEQVRAEQVRTLYRQSTPVLLASVVNALIVDALLWRHVSHALLLGWTAALVLMALVRHELRRRYHARERAPAEQPRWGVRFAVGSLAAGVLWGFAGGVLMPPVLPLQAAIVFVLGGMAAGAVASIACFMPAYYAYLLPALTPALVRLFLGDQQEMSMGAMLLLFMIALSVVARNVHDALAQAFRLRFENTELYEQVSSTQVSLVVAHDKLLRANQELDARVRQRTQELEANRRALAEIVRESPDAIVVFDEPGRIVSTNPAAEKIAGRPAETLIGKPFAEAGILDAADVARASAAHEALLRGEARAPEEFCIVRPNGERVPVEATLRIVSSGDGTRRIHSVIRDVSERHRLQRLRETYERRLREAERLDSVGMLAGGVAHDFNNLLTMILSNLDLLESFRDSEDPKALLTEIRHGAVQAASLTKQLLAFSRQQLLDVQPTDLARVVEHGRPMFERALGEQNQLSIKLGSEPVIALVDATQLEQAIVNLLVNARHALPQGGRAALELQRVDLHNDPDWPDAEPGPYVRVAVTDDGIGMDEATRRRVFEPFFTTKARGYGTGLGLSTVHGLIKQAGGYIRVLSEPGRGTRFELMLPYQAAATSEAGKTAAAAWTKGSGTVLVVEDQPQVRRSLERILEDAGYSVIATEDAGQALEAADKHEGRIDLVVSDVIMPGISGIELTRRLLERDPHLAVLLVSGYTGSEITLLGELGPSVQFLAKPFDAASLTSAAESALAQAREAARREQAAGAGDRHVVH